MKLMVCMREVMVCVEVGDDVFGDDCMVKVFECKMVEMFGFEVVVFMLSGIMVNLFVIVMWCDE